MVPLAACGNSSNSGTESPAGKSGLSSALVLSAASDAQKLQFCNWLASVAPADACSGASASSQDAGAPVTDGGMPGSSDGGASAAAGGEPASAAAQCLASFSGFTKDCSVVAAEECFSNWEASGACEVPATSTCAAYDACAKATPPKNDVISGHLRCSDFHKFGKDSSAGGDRGYLPWNDFCDVSLWIYVPCDQSAANLACKVAFPDCESKYCRGFYSL